MLNAVAGIYMPNKGDTPRGCLIISSVIDKGELVALFDTSTEKPIKDAWYYEKTPMCGCLLLNS